MAQPDTTANTGSSAASQPKLTAYQYASYGAPAMPLSMINLPLAVYLPAVYADSEGFGLSLGFVALTLALSRVFDGLTDPVVGLLSDRTRSRWGRRKPFMLLGTPIFLLGVWMLWVPFIEFSDISLFGITMSSGYPYLLLALVIMYVGATIKDVPYSALGAELARDYNERTLIMSWREGFSVSGSLIGAMCPALIVFWGFTRPADNVYFLSIICCVLMPIFVANLLFRVPEPAIRESNTQKMPIRESFRYVWQNEPYRKLVFIFLFSTIGSALTNSLSFFFVKHVLLAGELYGFYLAPYFISQIVAIPLWLKLSRRIGKHRATMCAIGWYAAWSCFIPLIAIAPAEWFTPFAADKLLTFLPDSTYRQLVTYFEGIPTGKFVFFIGVMMLKGSSIGALSALPYAMAADVVDVDTARTGKNQGGAYFSIWTMTRKLAYAGGLVAAGIAAGLIAFDSLAHPINNPNSAETLLWLAIFYSVVPALFKFVALPMLWNYSLTEERVREIQAEIADRAQRPSSLTQRQI
ncbi:MAG: MFS transporter [Pseudomonadota bacterium]